MSPCFFGALPFFCLPITSVGYGMQVTMETSWFANFASSFHRLPFHVVEHHTCWFVHYYLFLFNQWQTYAYLSMHSTKAKQICIDKSRKWLPLFNPPFLWSSLVFIQYPHFSFCISAASWLSRVGNLLLTLSSNEVCSCCHGDSGGQKGMFLCSVLARRARGRGKADRLDPSTLFILAPWWNLPDSLGWFSKHGCWCLLYANRDASFIAVLRGISCHLCSGGWIFLKKNFI